MTISGLRAAYRDQSLSPVAVVDRVLLQVERQNPRVNAFMLVFDAHVREAAQESERRIRAGNPRPLEGIPLTVKDSLDVAGWPTTCGSLLYRNRVAAADAASVQLLREAGAVLVGKTSCPEFLMNYETHNRYLGHTRNPWDPSKSAGGSSGGEAAAIATLCSAGGLGSDGGGSIRFPAHCCGIAGLKPTPGRISGAGHTPPVLHPGGLLGVVGPMARNSADLDALFQVLATYDPSDPFAAPVPRALPDLAALRNNRCIGMLRGWNGVPVEPAMIAAVEAAAAHCRALGYQVDQFSPQGLEQTNDLWWYFFGRLHSRVTAAAVERHWDQLDWTGTELLELALGEPEPTVADTLANLATRDTLRAALLHQMEQFPVLLLPASGVAAFAPRTRSWPVNGHAIGLREAMAPLTPFNLFGMPGLVIPYGFDAASLPCGIQLVARPYGEELLLALARELETARGSFPLPPGVEPLF